MFRRKYKRHKRLKFKLRKETIYTIFAMLLFASAALLAVSFFQTESSILVKLNQIVIDSFGAFAFLVPFLLISCGFLFFRLKFFLTKPNVFLGLILIFLSLLGLGKSGLYGEKLWENVAFLISSAGAMFLFIASLVIGLAIFMDTSIDEMAMFFINIGKTLYNIFFNTFFKNLKFGGKKDLLLKKPEIKISGQNANIAVSNPVVTSPKKTLEAHRASELMQSTLISNSPDDTKKIWEFPPLSLLSDRSGGEADYGDIKQNANIIENTLDSFGIEARVLEINKGPAVTQYALRIAQGTKLSKIMALSNDLALSLAAPTGQIRIEAPIPGRSLVGIEIPNRSLQIVTMKEMLLFDAMRQAESKLAVGMGLDVSGKPVVTEINKMPHVLVAGTTGSGKSVMINSWISCLLFRTTPQELRFIMVDPKRVELTAYNGIPHLLTPVIVEVDQTLSALKWAQGEMDRRYKLFANEGTRNIASYNEALGYQALPYIVIVIDELADLMIFAPAEVESSITRLAQMARATGIHLVLSTQRPSVDVLTGLIKANIPARIAFNVSSMIDSRVILDMPGAEKLLGRGDMLYIPPDQAKPARIQGTFISEKEVKALVEFLKTKTKAAGIPIEYTEEVTQQKVVITKPTGLMETTEGKDPLYEDAKTIITQYDRASASLLQRRLKVGYARAARILDQLEASGVVGPAEKSKAREVLVKPGQQVTTVPAQEEI